jgi:hypothetical protein
MNVLYGLGNAAISPTLKFNVAQRVFASQDQACLMAVLDLLGAIENEMLPDDAIQFIHRLAAGNPDSVPRFADEQHEGPLMPSLNTVRGHAVKAISDLVSRNRQYLDIFGPVIEQLVTDPDLSIRASTISALRAMAVHDPVRAVSLFGKLVDADDRLPATHEAVDFLSLGLREHMASFHGLIERMLNSAHKEVRQMGGQLACLARLHHESENELAEAALVGDAACRFGAASVAKNNLIHPNCRAWCEGGLRRLFNDEDKDVRKESAACFWYLWQRPDTPLTTFDSLIRAFVDSNAFTEEPTFLLHALEDTRSRVPEALLDICGRFVAKCGDKARDIRTTLAHDEYIVSKLVFRAYAQLDSHPLRARALDLIDSMCTEGLPGVRDNIATFER